MAEGCAGWLIWKPDMPRTGIHVESPSKFQRARESLMERR